MKFIYRCKIFTKLEGESVFLGHIANDYVMRQVCDLPKGQKLSDNTFKFLGSKAFNRLSKAKGL